MNETGTFEINVTSMLQHAVERGQEHLNILLQAEDAFGAVAGTYYMASSEYSDLDDRPKLTISYELTTPWSPCLLYTSPSPRDRTRSRMPSSA